MRAVLVTHADLPLGRRIVKRLWHEPGLERIVALGEGPPPRAFDAFRIGETPRLVYERLDHARQRSVSDWFKSRRLREIAPEAVVYVPRHGVAPEGPPVVARVPTRTAEARLVLHHALEHRSVRALVALGSAFVYDQSGLLLTNYHVIANASEIRVVFKDGHDQPAEILGTDPPTDVAVLRVPERGLPALALGDSDELAVGDWVVAIGNPYGLSHTVSAGILSGRGRTIRELEGLDDGNGYFDLLQTDASINPGNSGGPLMDLEGHVIGISAAMRARSNKIGFAIPSNMVRELIPALVAQGHVRRSALGVKVDSIQYDDLRQLGLSRAIGAVVRAVQPQSPAELAGFRVDDVIVEFDGHGVAGPERLRWLASMAGVSKRVAVTVQRHGTRIRLVAVLGELPPISGPPLDELEDDDE